MNRTRGPDRLRYQIHSWIGSLYLDCVPWSIADGCANPNATIVCPSATERATFIAALRSGDIVFAASPFNVNAEMVGDPGLLTDLVGISEDLERGAGWPANGTPPAFTSRVWSNVDVKGFARSSIPLLAAAGVTALYIGANGDIESPSVARSKGLQPVVGPRNSALFRWTDPVSNTEMVVMYHAGYGGYTDGNNGRDTCLISSGGVALCSDWRSDNSGPPETALEVRGVFAALRKEFPGAEIRASSLGEFARHALTPDVVNALPTTELDWGDQWLTGMSTDPRRLAVYRELARARRDCIVASRCSSIDPAIRNFTRFLAKIAEHTQGVQGEDWSPGIAGPRQKQLADTSHWSNAAFASVHNAEYNKFSMGDYSWQEARVFNDLAIETLGPNHPLAKDIAARLRKLDAVVPDTTGLRTAAVGSAIACGDDVEVVIGADGSVARLRVAGTDWASSMSSLFSLTYTTYNRNESWDPKVNLTAVDAEDAVWHPTVTQVLHNGTTATGPATHCRIVVELAFAAPLHTKYGAPLTASLELDVLPKTHSIDARLTWYNKSTTRLPESLMLGFHDQGAPEYGWAYDILGEWVRPDEVGQGTTNPYQRAVWSGVRYSAGNGSSVEKGLFLEVLDAGMVCPIVKPSAVSLLGNSTPIGEGTSWAALTPTNVSGTAVSLYQNLMPISGFAQWYPFGVGESYNTADQNSVFRFRLTVK
jgi:hypothetical protein